jgi:hypothetical protein
MKQLLLITCTIVLMIFSFSSCTGLKVISDKDATVDFQKIKTYQFVGWLENSDQQLNRFDRERIEQAFLKEGTERGLTKVDSDPDALVALFVLGEVKTQKTANTTTNGMGMGGMGMGMGMGGMRHPGWGWGGGMHMSQSRTVINETRYIEGTLMIEFFDPVEKKLIWQALGKKTVNEDPQKRARDIPRKVAVIMSKYPVKKVK